MDVCKVSNQVRKLILRMAFQAGAKSAHIGGALSSADIISVVFSSISNRKKNGINDRFILSKGHSCLALYSALAVYDKLPIKYVEDYPSNLDVLAGHPVINRKYGIEFSTGSLGMGISLAAGLAYSEKLKKNDSRIFCLVGDGECNEGAVWEALSFASSKKLDNLIIIVDRNNYQQTGSVSEISGVVNLEARIASFGFDVNQLNGNDPIQLNEFFEGLIFQGKPVCLIANTIKGAGLSMFENDNKWHHATLTASVYEAALRELNND